jgi:PAS domain S-box-containing protein
MKAAVEKKLSTGMVIAILSVLAIVILSIFQSRRLQDTGAIVKHTNQVLYQAQDVLDISLQYELGVKNFLLTGDSVFLDSAARLEPSLSGGIARLKALTSDNAGQQDRIDLLLRYIDKNREALKGTARLSQGNDRGRVAKEVALEATIGHSRQAGIVTGQIIAEELSLLDQRRKKNQLTASELQVVLWTLIAAVSILALVTFRKVRVDLAKEKEAGEQLNRSNRELAAEVRLQTGNLRASEEKYRTLFYKSPVPKWIYERTTLRFLEVNEAAIKNYGYSQEEFQRMTISDIRPPEDRERLQKDVEEMDVLPDVYRTGSWRHIKKNGEVIFVEITAHPIEYEHRKARMVVVIDVTEKVQSELLSRQLNEDLNKRAAELTASNAELERFAYIASHDLQEPLRMVSSFLQLLQKKYGGQLDEKADQYIHYAVDGAGRMKALIMDLLEYSRVGIGKESFGPVNMAVVISELEDVFREQIIALRARIDIGPLPEVWGDKVQLTQLFQNLVGNALKYHGDRPLRIGIDAQEEAGHWRFEVRDNGIGIDPLFFDKIFIIFQRLNNKSDYAGTGIGLAICKKIVERHGGRIWVESAPGEGSAFFFTIAKQP